MPTIFSLPAFALLFAATDEQSSRFVMPPNFCRQMAATWRIAAYRQHEDGSWREDMALVADDGRYACAGAMDLFASDGGDCRQRLIAAYRAHGEDFLAHIDGEFAFVLANTGNETIILGRDHLGLQALYYATDGKSLAVANSLAGISHLLCREPAVNAEYMFDFLARNVPKPDHSIYQDIHILPPGHFLVFRQGAARIEPYWRLEADRFVAISPDPAAGLRQLMVAAIKKRLPDKGKIVVQLSGGLDSSALLGFLAEIAEKERLVAVTRTFAAGYRNARRDELAFAQDAARHCGVPLVIVDEEVINPLPALEEYFQHLGNIAPNPYYDIGLPLHRRIHDIGNGVVFLGFGGDEGVSLPGDIALPQLFLTGRWRTLWRLLGEISSVYGHSRRKLFRHWLLPKLPPPWLDDYITTLRLPEESQLQHLVLLRGEARRAVSGGYKKSQLRHERTIAREIRAGVLGPLFVQTGEVNQFFSRRHDLRFFYPFLDQDILTYIVSLPPETFLMAGWQRGLFRRAIRGLMPDSILTRRTKSPFSLPFPIYIRATQEMIMDMCHTAGHPAWDYLDRRALAFYTRRVCREEISYPIELTAVAVGQTAAMAMFLENRRRYWRQKRAAER